MQILNNFNIEADFWETNPQLEIPFKEVKELPNSSKLMWSLALYVDPDSKFKNARQAQKKSLIQEDYFEEVDWEIVEKFVPLYKDLVLTKKRKFLVDWEQKMEERTEFLASRPYNEDNYEMLDKMMKDTEKMWSQYLKCLKDVEEEDRAHTHGNIPESIDEQGII